MPASWWWCLMKLTAGCIMDRTLCNQDGLGSRGGARSCYLQGNNEKPLSKSKTSEMQAQGVRLLLFHDHTLEAYILCRHSFPHLIWIHHGALQTVNQESWLIRLLILPMTNQVSLKSLRLFQSPETDLPRTVIIALIFVWPLSRLQMAYVEGSAAVKVPVGEGS
ncbi:hypothetical protein F5Y17DRAFT_242698 [Xylariaceae sp. FL0594]|nr:hypothetical protein F5Y17DRAFT_242698 [Xylariaceae sp. FL0594]